jgi:lipopolysaccharide transport system ATP-binding protein
MPKEYAILLDKVCKIYQLHGNQSDQLTHLLGMDRFFFKKKKPGKEYVALNDISLKVEKGQKIGLIGRNGAGKTTLLKLLCGNFVPTSGTVSTTGEIQALMTMGAGFHPEYSGRENAKAALQYNGLSPKNYSKALDGIIEFCELGDFLDQPFKTYSLGMQARLMFATATAILPEILVIDEVLGAGDAYFIAKSKRRVESLVSNGCTMLLVTHSMSQILELCEQALWLDQGRVRMFGPAFEVVKAYEEFMHGPIDKINDSIGEGGSAEVDESQENESFEELIDADQLIFDRERAVPKGIQFQEPRFIPHTDALNWKDGLTKDASKFDFVASGGVSRWASETGVKVCGFTVETEKGITNTLVTLRPAKFIINTTAELSGNFSCRYGIAIHDLNGICLTRIWSGIDSYKIKKGGTRRVEVVLNPCQLGPGYYTVGISVLDDTPFEKLNSAVRYDLLSRSFNINVELPGSLDNASASIVHSAEWLFN